MLTRTQCINWIEALRSGKYKQGKYMLHDKTDNTHCCLGVLCHINNLDTFDESGLSRSAHSSIRLDKSDIEPEFNFTQLGTADDMGIPLINGIYKSLAKANDNDVTFADIADHLEKYYLPQCKD